MDYEKIIRVGINSILKGGKILKDCFEHIIKDKKNINLSSTARTLSERAIAKTIGEAFPTHKILLEDKRNRGYCWLIISLSETTNFLHGLGIFSVSVLLSFNGKMISEFVLNPILGELFVASVGKGATLNGFPIRVSETNNVRDSLLATDLLYDQKVVASKETTNRLVNSLNLSQGVRFLNAPTIELCYVSCGIFDGFWINHLRGIGTIAGLIIAQEAKATLTDLSGNLLNGIPQGIIATNGKIHKEMINLLATKED